ncbi:MAG: DUF2325 domain-containing protein [Proteobacteria bacterium]|nr:DUF2325 domain-containing protein [Pseudomonadota bacterium]MBU1387986.1 DUF2325 domain-containing protein [Pseudomonadota bacterium]MBU1542049.1 DUF2325 domain-containing protein [Pseudomonadota bacterium]MBU2431166.1 DUF2325 domain-containing protein [Pseudomonadota bacterium]MBU2482833.1 DUF2325 domain-containing protein [Pseudomonadota bacterium]
MSDILSGFMNIWEVESHFKCPVIGAMLSVEKHRSILVKCGYDVKKMKPYEYHQVIMSKVADKNNVSVKVNNFIRAQARTRMVQIADFTDDQVRVLWKRELEAGNVGPMMYAIISREDTGVELLSDIQGEVHMLAHANMTGIFDVRKKLLAMEEALGNAKRKLVLKTEEIKHRAQAGKISTRQISLLEQENQKLKNRISAMEAQVRPPLFDSAAETLSSLEKDLKAGKQALRVMEREKRSLQIELFSTRSENELLKKEMQTLVDALRPFEAPPCAETGQCPEESCPRYRLCARRVFMVGGMTKMKSFYKDIIEKAGGEFDYHDGYMKNSSVNMDARVRRCDMVLCPVNCNSHNACLMVKKLCYRHNKPLKILSSASLSAVTQAVFDTEIPSDIS